MTLPKHKYYDLPNDGALFTCSECKETAIEDNPLEPNFSEARGPASQMWLVIMREGKRFVVHKACAQPEWIEKYAEYGGSCPEYLE